MLRKVSFGLFDTGETILSALVFSTFFPLYITQHIDTKLYSLLYGFSFLVSFGFALYLGKLADARALRKLFFGVFGILTGLACFLIGVFYGVPTLALSVFLLMAVLHQQALVFYNSLLLTFESRGFTSGLGVALGYVGSAFALVFLAENLKAPQVYYVTSILFVIFLLPSLLAIKNPYQTDHVSLKEVFRDKRFVVLILSILSVTEVANTLVAMMGVYLREVFSMESVQIYRVIGISALGGVFGGVLWGKLSDLLGVRRVFWAGFLLWISFLVTLPFATKEVVLIWGLLAGLSLSHIWTTSRVLILSEFPEGEASVRLSFLSLTERVASTTGLIVWSLLLYITGDDYRISAGMMAVFPLVGVFLFLRFSRS